MYSMGKDIGNQSMVDKIAERVYYQLTADFTGQKSLKDFGKSLVFQPTLSCICEGCQVKLEYEDGDNYPLEDGLCYHCIYGYEDDLYDIERDRRACEDESTDTNDMEQLPNGDWRYKV